MVDLSCDFCLKKENIEKSIDWIIVTFRMTCRHLETVTI